MLDRLVSDGHTGERPPGWIPFRTQFVTVRNLIWVNVTWLFPSQS
jgi:hypothetical protein